MFPAPSETTKKYEAMLDLVNAKYLRTGGMKPEEFQRRAITMQERLAQHLLDGKTLQDKDNESGG